MSNRPISNHDTPDPWLIPSPLQPGIFYLTFTLGNRIEIWSSDNLESFHDHHPALRKSVIWQPSPGSPWSADVWAPELHFLFGTWWVYAAGAPPSEGNKGHRTIVLRCTDPNRDPMNGGSWVFEGPMRGLPNYQWSIDATVFSPDPAPNAPGGRPDEQRRWYVCYSGWPLGDNSDTQQDLFLARLRNPVEADESSLVCISRAELPWERPDGGRRGVNEGPTWVAFQNGQWRGIVYSAHGSWTNEYKLGLLQFVGGPSDDLCNTGLWRKRPSPLLVSDRDMGGPFGPGHASFIPNPSDGRLFCIYHGTEKDDEGWNNRKGRVLCMGPDVFHDSARTMCCAYNLCGPPADTHGVFPTAPAGAQGQNWQQQPHQQQQAPPQGQQRPPPSSPPLPNQGIPNYGQSWQGQQPQGYNQNWQTQQPPPPPPQHTHPQSGYQSPPPAPHSPPQYPPQQPGQSFSPPPIPPHPNANQGSQTPSYPFPNQHSPAPQQPQNQYPGHPQAQASSAYPGQYQQQQQQQQQQFQPPPQTYHPQQQQQQQQQQSMQGYPSPGHQMYPGQPGQSQTSQYGQPQQQTTSGSGSGGGSFDKYTNEIQKRIPAQYQGYFNKAKKFLK